MRLILGSLKDQAPDRHPFFGKRLPDALRLKLEQLGPGATATDRVSALWSAGLAELQYDPTPGRAIEHLTVANSLLVQLTDRSVSKHVKFLLATAHLRQGEVENCCLSSNADSCILPIRRGGVHARTEGSRQAIRYFLECLEETDPLNDDDLSQYFSAVWLLNVAYMTLNEYPDNVPQRYRIPPEFFQSSVPFPRFENVMPKLGLNTKNFAGGLIVDDFNNDDYLDIFTCSAAPTSPTRYFQSNQDGTFTERTEEAGLTGLFGGLNAIQADYNNDGHLDVYIMRGAWMGAEGRHPDSLLRNDGGARFTDVTFESGLGAVHYPNKSAAWADYDNDGDLDLYVVNESRYDGYGRGAEGVAPVRCPSQLFQNKGDGTLEDVAAAAGVQVDMFGMGAVWGDYDADRFPDLFLSGSQSRMFRNSRDGTFVDVTDELGIRRPIVPFATWFWDFDNDAALDLFITSTAFSIDRLALRALGVETESRKEGHIRLHPKEGEPAGPHVEYEIPALYRGDGHGGFSEVAREQGLTFPVQPMGANFGDLDGDGYLDFYLSTGNVPYWDLWPNAMYLNRGGKGFVNVTMDGGFGHLQKGHGVSFADIDNDGDQDVYSKRGGQLPGDVFTDALFENPGFGNHWITIKLVGKQSNRSAIGAVIHVTVGEGDTQRLIYRQVSSGGSFGCNPLRNYIGLGKADRIVAIEVYWPTTDQRQIFHDVAMDQSIVVTEGDDRWKPMQHVRQITLGGR